MKQPLVSIIVPTLNAGKYIRECLQSISDQSYKNYEILIVDGGSSDPTLEIVKNFKNTQIISQTDTGLAGAWNDGIQNVKGDLIAFLDSDDKWNKDCLLNHVRLREIEPGIKYSIGHLEFFLDDPDIVPPGFKTSLLQTKHLGYMPGCFMGTKEIFEKMGMFETKWRIASDIVWFAKLKRLNEKPGIIEDVILYKRVHQQNLSYTTAQTPLYQKELLQFLHEMRANNN